MYPAPPIIWVGAAHFPACGEDIWLESAVALPSASGVGGRACPLAPPRLFFRSLSPSPLCPPAEPLCNAGWTYTRRQRVAMRSAHSGHPPPVVRSRPDRQRKGPRPPGSGFGDWSVLPIHARITIGGECIDVHS